MMGEGPFNGIHLHYLVCISKQVDTSIIACLDERKEYPTNGEEEQTLDEREDRKRPESIHWVGLL